MVYRLYECFAQQFRLLSIHLQGCGRAPPELESLGMQKFFIYMSIEIMARKLRSGVVVAFYSVVGTS